MPEAHDDAPAPGAAVAAADPGAPTATGHRRPARWVTFAVVLLVVLPVLVLVVDLAQRNWYPTGDQAQAELRMLSLPRHVPLVGQPGRIVDHQGRQGSHPGPLMYWATWPLYALLGQSSWAFEAATALVNAAWLAVCVWLVRRRAGAGVALWSGIVLLVLAGGYGLNGLSQPWNPWVALLPFSTLLFATWGLLDGDRWLLPLAVFAGSYALEGHAGYAVLVPLLLLAGTLAVVVPVARDRLGRDRPPAGGDADAGGGPTTTATGEPAGTGRRVRWAAVPIAVAVIVGLVAWSGPIVDVLHDHPSNLSKLIANFGSPSSPPIGIGRAAKLVLQSFAPTGAWVFGGNVVSGSVVPGVLVLAAWAAVAVLCARRGLRALTRLNAVLAGSVVFGVYAMSRIFGDVYLYVFRWVCALMAGLVFTLGWGLFELLRSQAGAEPRVPRPALARRGTALGLAVLLALSGVTSFRLAHADLPYSYSGRLERQLAPVVARSLHHGTTYLVRWDDPAYLGGLGFGLILDLERRGFHVGADPRFSTAVEPRRVLCPGQYHAIIEVVSGDTTIAKWRATPGYRLIASADVRTPAQRRAYNRDLNALHADLAARGTPLTMDEVTQRINFLLLDTKQPKTISRLASRLVTLGVPSAAFLAEPAPQEPPVPHDPLDEPCWK